MTNEEFARIIDETKGVVISAIKAHLFEHYGHAVDDVVQEVYLRAYRSLVKGGFEERAKLSTWLYTIAKNEAIRMNYRLKREEHKKDLMLFFFKETVQEADEGPDLDAKTVEEKIEQLPVRYRTIMAMYYGGVSGEEIAGKLEITVGTVKSRIHKGKKLVKALVNRLGAEARK